MRSPLCFLASVVPGSRPAPVAAHRRRCPTCRAEAGRAAALIEGLASLAGWCVPAPAGLRADVLAALGEQDAGDPRHDLASQVAARHAAVAGLVVAALVALLAGLARRHSRALG